MNFSKVQSSHKDTNTLLTMEESESAAFRDRIAELYVKCRCEDHEAYAELESLAASSSSHPSPEDTLVVKGYLGDLLLISKSRMIPYNESRGKALLSGFFDLDRSTLKCKHLQHLLAVYLHDCCTGMKEEAIELFWKAADQGHPHALSTLGFFCEHGEGVRKDFKKALSLYEAAAKIGSPVAQFNIGSSYQNGSCCEENLALAFEWYKKAASQGLAEAHWQVGVFYRFGRGTKENFPEAVKHFTHAANSGHPRALYRLAWCYQNGRGVSQDSALAVRLQLSAAELGDVDAAEFMGQAYESGLWGVKISIIEAMRNYRRAIKSNKKNRVGHDVSLSVLKVTTLSERYKAEVRVFVVSFYDLLLSTQCCSFLITLHCVLCSYGTIERTFCCFCGDASSYIALV